MTGWKPRVAVGVFGAALIAAVVLLVTGSAGTLWGLTPIVVYAILVLLDVDVVLATLGALVIAALQTGTAPLELGELMGESLGSFIAVVGLIVLLGGGLGRVVTETGAAATMVRAVLHGIGISTRLRFRIGVMASATLLAAALGTLSGASALLVPIVLPIAAALRLTPPSMAAMLHAGTAAGLVVGPFTPPVVTVMGAAQLGYGDYLLNAGIPMAVVVWLTGLGMSHWIQRRTEGTEAYPDEVADDQAHAPAAAKRAMAGFLGSMAVLVVLGIVFQAGYTYVLIVMPVSAAVTALLGRMAPSAALQAMYRGAQPLLWLFLLFWLLNPMLELLEKSGAYDALQNLMAPTLDGVGPWLFCMIVLLVGWLGISGAAVAQVVLLQNLFGPALAAVGVPPGAWAAVLLGSSQIDWFGPFPGPDMIGQMGLARSRNLRMMMYNGWAIMVANLALFAVLFLVLV
ncbi:GntP family permease [Saccharopolyspora kobensis]|uniref:GntP family permease n=1 Tax=Saccharopolyspora kobensis TaxID=146035 RepID=A0A1H6EI00_9PSEU|nr:gluconate:proton symporter [Saccharopolyspora kobensis]SEG97457.1 GntP family permease [Saccharopolyspora kobensis]SFC79176.1 GntP family permease [Saccharopolyspora kobensis]